VIIGTIFDERIKKGEMKITVIATGFPNEGGKKNNLFGAQSAQQIFNTAPRPEPQPIQTKEPTNPMVQKPEIRSEEPEVVDGDGTEEDWGAIPAFLRRNKK
jgi:cell division GTPase FtsZ